MPESNQSQEQLPAQDFNAELKQAESSGDFDYVLDTAKKSHRMLIDFRDAIHMAVYPGKNAGAIAMGLNFLENMISNSAGQVSALKQAEKQTRDALRKQAQEAATPKRDDPQPASEAPAMDAPQEAPAEQPEPAPAEAAPAEPANG